MWQGRWQGSFFSGSRAMLDSLPEETRHGTADRIVRVSMSLLSTVLFPLVVLAAIYSVGAIIAPIALERRRVLDRSRMPR
jgi:hypothetical protein